jgi:hypothetical protein
MNKIYSYNSEDKRPSSNLKNSRKGSSIFRDHNDAYANKNKRNNSNYPPINVDDNFMISSDNEIDVKRRPAKRITVHKDSILGKKI